MDERKEGPVLNTVCSAVIEATERVMGEAVINDELLDFCTCLATETFEDVKCGSELSSHQALEAAGLVKEFECVFTDLPGTTNLTEHRIRLTADIPVRCKPYFVPYSVRKSLQEGIQRMIDMDVIRPSESPYSSPVVVVRKRDETNRICIEYRRLNRITLPDFEPMTCMPALTQNFGKSKYFSKLDLSKGYWQISVAKEEVYKTAFVTLDGCSECVRMPFGMMNSGATLVRAMRKLFQGLTAVDSYVDDTIVHAPSWQEHMGALLETLDRIAKAGLKVRSSKCLIGAESLDCIGHHIGKGIIEPDEENLRKVRNATRPTTKIELRSFIGLAGFHRDFVPNFSGIAVPLADFTKKGQLNQFEWEEAQKAAYRTLKNAVTSKPVLHLPDHDKSYTLRVDPSEVAIVAVLLQEHDNSLFPVVYRSKKQTSAERRYSTIERECIAVIGASKSFTVTCTDVSLRFKRITNRSNT